MKTITKTNYKRTIKINKNNQKEKQPKLNRKISTI